MTNEKGTRHTYEPDKLIEHRVKGEVEPLMASKVPVDMDSIFDDGIFENVHPPLVILVEGAFGSGKSTLAYHYCQKWAEGNLEMFELVALVYLRHPAVHSAGKGLTLHQLLLLASDGEEGNDDIARHVVQLIEKGVKVLLILDGWDEGPACLRAPPDPKLPPDNSFLGKLLRSVSSYTTILITSRPDSSVDLHKRANVKRVEILGFTKESIHDYFHEALSTQLSSTILEDECRKLRDHLIDYPAIESSCYIPLNAAILTLLYLQRNRTLPTTHFEMFYKLLLCCIAREVNTRQPERTLGTISSLDALPCDLKKQLEHISILAYEGVINNKIVFTQDELPSILPSVTWDMIINLLSNILPAAVSPTPVQQDLPAMGVLQRVQWAGTSSETISYNFVHLSIQEMLAAYRISKIGDDEQVRVFQTLLGEPRFAAVLQFYAGFTKLTNEGVRNFITGSDFIIEEFSQLYLLSYIRCFFEAQIHDQPFYKKIIRRLFGRLFITDVTLSPLDCMSIGFFLSIVLRNSSKLDIYLCSCGIDDHSLGLMMVELSKHAEACQTGALHGVTELNIENNKIGDNGIAHVATALQTNTTMTELDISQCSISDEGAESLARAFAVNRSLQELDMSCNKIGDKGIAHIATALQTNTTMTKLDISQCSISDEGAESLARALAVNRSLQELDMSWNEIGDKGIAHIATTLQTNTTMTKLDISHCSISDEGAESLARALAVNRSLQELYISENEIGDKGIAHIAKALQTNITMTKLYIRRCSISDEGVQSLARALAVNKSLQELYISENEIGDNGIAHIAKALQTSNNLTKLVFEKVAITDEGVLSLAAALTANSSMEHLWLSWSSVHPDSTVKKIEEYVRRSTLISLGLVMNIPSHAMNIPSHAKTEKIGSECLRLVEVGGKELMEDSGHNFRKKCFILDSRMTREYFNRQSSIEKLEAAATAFNTAREQKKLHCFRLSDYW